MSLPPSLSTQRQKKFAPTKGESFRVRLAKPRKACKNLGRLVKTPEGLRNPGGLQQEASVSVLPYFVALSSLFIIENMKTHDITQSAMRIVQSIHNGSPPQSVPIIIVM